MANERPPIPVDPYDAPVRVPAHVLQAGLSRRGVLKAMGLLGAAAAVPIGGSALAGPAAADYVLPDGFEGTIADLKHVVILIQENRSFDHYYGSLPGVRGFDDKQALQFADGTDVFSQPQGSGVVKPARVTTVTGMKTGLDHSYTGGLGAWADGRLNGWIGAKGTACMNHMTGEELPFQYALASSYTICDANHCSLPGPTTPNRLFHWTGTSGGQTGNGNESSGTRAWKTYPEVMQAAGVTWRNYVDNSSDGSSWIGDYTDNPIRGFATISPTGDNLTDTVKNAPGTGLMWRAGSAPYATHGLPNNDSETNLNGVLADFIAACQPDAQYPLPEVSWIIAPKNWSEHPDAEPEHGAHFTNRVIETLDANPAIGDHTLLIMGFDENDGYFDHVLPPRPETGTKDEFSGSTPLGYGARVPLVLVSPWTRGGWVCSEVFDHTSILRFLEVWTKSLGKEAICPNISDWRRSISGDLTSAIDFTHPVLDRPTLPDTSALVYIADNAPSAAFAAQVDDDDKWVEGTLRHRPLPFHPHGTFSEDRSKGVVTAHLSLVGGPDGKGVSLQAFPDKYATFANTPYTVTADAPRTHTWDVTTTDGRYAFTVYGPDGFVRSHAGTLLPKGQDNAGVPSADVDLVAGDEPIVRITLRNDGLQPVRFTLTAHEFDGGTRRTTVARGASTTVEWPTADGYYDVVITADTGTGWRHRYAGRVAQAV